MQHKYTHQRGTIKHRWTTLKQYCWWKMDKGGKLKIRKNTWGTNLKNKAGRQPALPTRAAALSSHTYKTNSGMKTAWTQEAHEKGIYSHMSQNSQLFLSLARWPVFLLVLRPLKLQSSLRISLFTWVQQKPVWNWQQVCSVNICLSCETFRILIINWTFIIFTFVNVIALW